MVFRLYEFHCVMQFMTNKIDHLYSRYRAGSSVPFILRAGREANLAKQKSLKCTTRI